MKKQRQRRGGKGKFDKALKKLRKKSTFKIEDHLFEKLQNLDESDPAYYKRITDSLCRFYDAMGDCSEYKDELCHAIKDIDYKINKKG